MTNAKAVSLMKLTKAQILELYVEAQHKLNQIKMYLGDKEDTDKNVIRCIEKVVKE